MLKNWHNDFQQSLLYQVQSVVGFGLLKKEVSKYSLLCFFFGFTCQGLLKKNKNLLLIGVNNV